MRLAETNLTPRPPSLRGKGETNNTRQRSVGRIGGGIGARCEAAGEALLQALGPDAQILSDTPESGLLVADWDSCWLSDKAVASLSDWQHILDARRLADVEGAFAIAWRSSGGGLTLARDAIGERTLYYAVLPGGVIFASTIRALLATGLIPRGLHLPSVATYLAYAYLPGRETMVSGIHEVLPGETIQFRGPNGEISAERGRLRALPAEPPSFNANEDELCAELRARLERAVRRRLPAGEPVGAALSGGLDSSLFVALVRKLHDAPVHTYSVSFGSDYANELPFSSLMAKHCQTRHRVIEISPAAIAERLDESIGMLSEPIGDPLTVPNALLFEAAAADTGVMLNGEGGDPCFGGPKNLPMLLAELYGTGDGASRAREQSYLRAHLKCFDDFNAMLSPDVRAALAAEPLEEKVTSHFADPRWSGFVTKLQILNVTFKGGHHILPKVDALSAPFGVLARSPLFDRAVVELSFALPPQLKLRGSIEKYLLKETVKDLLPAAIIERPKSGMLVPVEAWFQGPLSGMARARLLDGLTPYNLFKRDYLERLLAGKLSGLRPRHGAKIWLLLTLESWLRTHDFS